MSNAQTIQGRPRRSITDEIMYTIMELSGQEYVDMYAPAAKEAAAREAKAQEVDDVSPQA